ncbi:class I SAM-dependent methyltransferase [Viridibacillus sp. NPDC096237]|uniref:class I SAM-dependent methyltransferase n=1 Tax=Viridibacillus sp. NPDC096237 TaxID=3390721 RepID=UPI003D02651C
MNWVDLKKEWLLEEQYNFKGWDFSHLAGRWEEEELPWDYKRVVLDYLKPEHQLLDMGTGGGEFLLTLGHPFENTSVTEAWEANVNLCKNTLEPLGICVQQVFEDTQLPFDENSFDLIINRHEAYDVQEIKRLLKPDGIFITQQVGGKNNELLSKFIFGNFQTDYSDLCLRNEMNKFASHNFIPLFKHEYFPYLRFFDVAAIVYYAKIIEWEFPGFTVEKYYDKLCLLQKNLLIKGYLESFEHRFCIVVKNNK